MAWRSLTDIQSDLNKRAFTKLTTQQKGGLPTADERKCFQDILTILLTGPPKSELPETYGATSRVNNHLNVASTN